MRSALKDALERLLVGSGIAAARRFAMRGRTLILAYHDVVPDGEQVRGDLSLHLPQRAFADQLDILRRYGRVVPLSGVENETFDDRPRFALTFDDAYRGALTAAVTELRLRDMPATVFTAPGLLGQSPWWDQLADPRTGLTPERERTHATMRLAGRQDAVLGWARAESGRLRTLVGAPSIGTLDELRAALEYAGLTVGSHSWSHANLAALSGPELESELATPAQWLMQTFPGRYVSWIAYPYGLATTATERAAAAAGYSGALRVDGGWLSRRPLRSGYSRFALPRLNVPRGLSAAGFSLRASGIVPRQGRTITMDGLGH